MATYRVGRRNGLQDAGDDEEFEHLRKRLNYYIGLLEERLDTLEANTGADSDYTDSDDLDTRVTALEP